MRRFLLVASLLAVALVGCCPPVPPDCPPCPRCPARKSTGFQGAPYRSPLGGITPQYPCLDGCVCGCGSYCRCVSDGMPCFGPGCICDLDCEQCPGPGPCPLPRPAPTPAPGPNSQVAPDGTEPSVDIPVDRRTRNIGSKIDGKGMCVTTSITVAADWQNLPKVWLGYRDWCAQAAGGGSWPSKNHKQLAQFAKAKGVSIPPHVEQVGGDPSALLEAASRTGRMAAVTWWDGHMLNCTHFDSKWGAIMDNNGNPNHVRWMSRAQALQGIRGRMGSWVYVWLAPPPPPPPRSVPRAVGQQTGKPGQVVLPAINPYPGGVLPWQETEQGFYLNGQKVSQARVMEAITRTIPDDTNKLHLTTICQTREQAEGLKAALYAQDLAARCHRQAYALNDWAVRPGFLKVSGQVYLQDRSGRVLLRRTIDSEESAMGLMEALRKADPLYDPSKDPDGRPKPAPAPQPCPGPNCPVKPPKQPDQKQPVKPDQPAVEPVRPEWVVPTCTGCAGGAATLAGAYLLARRRRKEETPMPEPEDRLAEAISQVLAREAEERAKRERADLVRAVLDGIMTRR